MKFLTQFKSCDVVTVNNGVIQAIKGPIAYFGYSDKFNGKRFAIDAKMFVASLKKMKQDFLVIQENDLIKFIDESQEVVFQSQPAEVMLNKDKADWRSLPNFVTAWNIVNSFIVSDFPAIRIGENYLEVLSDKSIVRVETETEYFQGNFANIKLPANCKTIAYHNNKLWFAYSPYDYIVINKLDVILPSTNNYFNIWPDVFDDIPFILKERFVETEYTEYKNNNVFFIQKDKATAMVEDIKGSGMYEGKLFKHLIEYGDRYTFLPNYVAFENTNIKGIIANVK